MTPAQEPPRFADVRQLSYASLDKHKHTNIYATLQEGTAGVL